MEDSESRRRPLYEGTSYELMAEYNAWMNRKLYDVCATIPDVERRKDLGAFFRSVHGTLNHLLFGDLAWMGRFTGELLTSRRLGENLYEEFDELRAARESTDARIIAWARGLEAEWLASPLTYTSGVDGVTRTIPTWVAVTHMFNHETHHRGQLTTLLSQLGRDPGVTDIPWLPSLNAEHADPFA